MPVYKEFEVCLTLAMQLCFGKSELVLPLLALFQILPTTCVFYTQSCNYAWQM